MTPKRIPFIDKVYTSVGTEEWHQRCGLDVAEAPSVSKGHVNLKRLCTFLSSHAGLSNLSAALRSTHVPLGTLCHHKPATSSTTTPAKSKEGAAMEMKFEEGGKFEDLPGAKIGEVVVRFPPEASGFMHIGHAKAALLNYHYKQIFKGKLLLRFDDTNPAKENADFEEAILADLPRLGVHWDSLTYTSDYFDRMIDFCTQLIKDGKAYADDTDAETMRNQREARQESACRHNSVEKNLAMWKEMQEATEHGLKTCIRAKIDMSSDNGAMRDPTIFRCKLEPHIRTGTKYKVFPIYDFACPIVDSLEGVTHALRTSEYNDRNEQYYWMCDALKIRKPLVIDFSRLALQSTLLSKRKLTWFVDQGIVTGWDDPRMPTVRGILRHGLTPEGLRQFILAQGSSKATGTMEWDKIWAFNKKVIDPVAPRYTGLLITHGGLVPVNVDGQKTAATKQVGLTALHPKDPTVGEKTIVLAPVVFVEHADAECFTEGQNVTFVNWGNLRITKIHKKDGVVVSVDAELNLEDTDYKKTQKVTWLADPNHAKNLPQELTQLTPLSCLTYGPLISKPLISKDENFVDFVNRDAVTEESYFGDPQLRHLRSGDIIQIQRKGFFICDRPYMACHEATGKESPCVLIFIPDGATKARPTTGSKYTVEKSGDKASESSEPKGSAKGKPAANLSPEEAAKRAEKERQKEEKKAARKAGREQAKLKATSQHSTSPPAASTTPAASAASAKKPTGGVEPSNKKEKTAKPKETHAPNESQKKSEESSVKKQTRLGLEAKKEEDTAEWYTQVITKAEMLEYYDVSGCYILRPWSYFIWSQIQAFFDKAIAALGVDNAYFPIFVSKAALELEKEHIADFAPEASWEAISLWNVPLDFDCLNLIFTRIALAVVQVAWVTRSGSSDFAEPVAIRPTSETVMYPAFAKTREFLWQEGHTAFATKDEAAAEVLTILDLYRDVYRDLLAIPAIRGRKTEREKFPGGDYTTTVEVYIGASGRCIQGATSHHLGQNFSRMFNVVFEDPETKVARHVYQNSWGITTRTIGVMVMVHSDNQGLVLPPRVAKYQVVVVPCGVTAKTTDAERAQLAEKATEIANELRNVSGLRVHLDDRDHVSPGWKFNHWELKGVPVRVEIGFKDLAARQVTAVIRCTGEKRAIPLSQLNTAMPALLDEIHSIMLTRAVEEQVSHIVSAEDMEGLTRALDKKCLVLAPFCGEPACEDAVRTESAQNVVVTPGAPSMGAKSLCVPFDNELVGLKTGCVDANCRCIRHPLCTRPATFYTLFGRSY
ncbi:unnamed protein product [Mesocestoides corti]|uniref:Aminoacyl-transfer RNA synthetases class-II family profile domain-containing protein n=1 Tax=Mesocestoides corti TaxID=53468 RepID=A0A0R3UNM6_MESCO|nr:unnamed protein product [Mesocestoides corti]